MWFARLRLAVLWLAHVARVMADNSLRLYVVLELAKLGDGHRDSAFHLVSFLFLAPAVLLAPFNGALANSLPKPWVLIGSAAFAVGAALMVDAALLTCWIAVALSAAVNGPVRYALLPAAAHDTRWPLTRINGVFELGSALAIVGGVLLGTGRFQLPFDSTVPQVVLTLFTVALVAALPVRFASDVRRPESALEAVGGFFTDFGRVWRHREIRGCLVGLSLLRGLITGMMGALVAATLADGEARMEQMVRIGGWVFAGVASGSLLAGLQRHPRRIIGMVPWGASFFALGLVLAAFGVTPTPVWCLLVGTAFGLVNVPLASTYQGDLPADARGNGMAVRNFADYLCVALIVTPLWALGRYAGVGSLGQLAILAVLASVAAAWSWRFFLREVFELLTEFAIFPLYRIRGHGPGLNEVPLQGPAILIANHSAWLDPIWIAKVVPRRLIPMLTSVFFDLPALRWVMSRIANAIRVEASTFRREVPEIQEAIRVLDSNDCLIMFPEGALRKKEERLLKQFGQGVWHILKERPNTPVIVCWIEGGWGSFFSYFKGPPTKNKRLDFLRRIDVAVEMPFVMDPAVLGDLRTTRLFLMEKCLAARSYLGLEAPPPLVEKELEEETA